MTHGTRVRYVLGWSLLASLPVLHCEELSIPREYEGRLIQAVRFEPPLQPVTREDLARLVPFQPGAPLRQGDIRDAIKRLYKTGEYQKYGSVSHFQFSFSIGQAF